MIVHLTARALRLSVPLTDHRVASWLWSRLRRAFPDAHAAAVMPNHLHILTPTEDPERACRQLSGVLGGLRRRGCPGREVRWEPLGPAEIMPDRRHLRRMVRYVALNPCRAGLADDPLEWPWSTHRDAVGAMADPWIYAPRLAAALCLPSRHFAQELHRYISADPSVNVTGTPFPCPAVPVDLAVRPLAALVAATAVATRGTPADILREGRARAIFLHLAARHGWRDTGRLAVMCDIRPGTVRWRLHQPPDTVALAAAELCLGDERLLNWWPPAGDAVRRDRARNCREASKSTALGAASACPLTLFVK